MLYVNIPFGRVSHNVSMRFLSAKFLKAVHRCFLDIFSFSIRFFSSNIFGYRLVWINQTLNSCIKENTEYNIVAKRKTNADKTQAIPRNLRKDMVKNPSAINTFINREAHASIYKIETFITNTIFGQLTFMK